MDIAVAVVNVAGTLIVKVVALTIEVTVVPAGIPPPVTRMPTTIPVVLEAVMVFEPSVR
jgi:hypothetical protein